MAVQNFVDEALRILDASVRTLIDSEHSNDVLDAEETRLSALYRNVQRLSTAQPGIEDFGQIIHKILIDIQTKKEENEAPAVFQAPLSRQSRGRPLYIITREQLSYMVEMGFTTVEMSKLLHVSKSVVKRRLRNYNLSLRQRYSNITDEDLDDKVREVTQNNQSLGQRVVQGMLSSQGIIVQRQRVAESLIRVDEAGVALRW